MAPDGKESRAFMEKAVYPHLGALSEKVKVGPGVGLDNGVVSLGGGRAMIVTADPVSAIPAFGMKASARLSAHLITSDFTTSGVDPEFAIFSYNFPADMTKGQREEYVAAMGDECEALGVTIIAGHTGSYPGGGFTVIGGGVMLGFAAEGKYVTPAMARAGDAILMTKHAAIEATATLARSFPKHLTRKIGVGLVERAAKLSDACSTVEEARRIRGVGLGARGVTSMHDATEGGVLGALAEMSEASGKAFLVDPLKMPVSPEATAVCREFGIDPLRTMGEGSLIVTCPKSRVGSVKRALAQASIPATEVGRVAKGGGLWRIQSGRRDRVGRLSVDPFWQAYDRAVRGGLK